MSDKLSDKPDSMGEQIGRLTSEISRLELAVRLSVDLGQAQNEAIAAMEKRLTALESELQEHERKGLAASAVAAFVLVLVAIVVAKALG